MTIHMELAMVDALTALADQAGVGFSAYVRGVLDRHVTAKRRRG